MPASDFKKLRKQKIKPRTRAYTPVSELLREHFPEFTLRGLSGEEWYRAQNAKDGIQAIAALFEAAAGSNADKAKALRDFMGLDPEQMPDKLVMDIDLLAKGCVEPAMDQQDAAWLFEKFPMDARNMSAIISHMTGQGSALGESPASGAVRKSSPPCVSDIPEAACSTSSSPTSSPTDA